MLLNIFSVKHFSATRAGARIPGAPLFRAKCDYRVVSNSGTRVPDKLSQAEQQLSIDSNFTINYRTHGTCVVSADSILCIFPPVALVIIYLLVIAVLSEV